jgi:hypothetical protein
MAGLHVKTRPTIQHLAEWSLVLRWIFDPLPVLFS